MESILDICATVPIHFVIADGIVAMEGNGPLNGRSRSLGKIVLADDLVAADATCARLMGFEPDRIVHLHEGSRFLGNASPALIDQVGETVDGPATPFQVVPEFRYLHTTGGLNPSNETLAFGTLCRERNCKWQTDEWDDTPRHSARWWWNG
jgi:Domain of unknown function (DUF362)